MYKLLLLLFLYYRCQATLQAYRITILYIQGNYSRQPQLGKNPLYYTQAIYIQQPLLNSTILYLVLSLLGYQGGFSIGYAIIISSQLSQYSRTYLNFFTYSPIRCLALQLAYILIVSLQIEPTIQSLLLPYSTLAALLSPLLTIALLLGSSSPT